MANSESTKSFSLFAGLPETIDACHRFAAMVIEKYPTLGMVAVLLILAFPFYLVHTWGSVRREEQKGDQRLKNARLAHKKKGQSGGKTK